MLLAFKNHIDLIGTSEKLKAKIGERLTGVKIKDLEVERLKEF